MICVGATAIGVASVGTVFGSLVVGYARNPSHAVIGFTLSEAIGLFCLVMAFMILFAHEARQIVVDCLFTVIDISIRAVKFIVCDWMINTACSFYELDQCIEAMN
ncbi:hypothetical protein KUTeg_024736 [Tegillarca granosa]|uniref:ATPase protein 9 n=1 Tax=Tegillarca granosa TaxID=220873 RepID=A0ABQ9DZ76_TEGGR|nr:hypothetical protein KUTeg_024736 [Tegillarca granosa]